MSYISQYGLQGPVGSMNLFRKSALNILFGFLLTFICSLTLGNAPYAFVGYGLSAFALFFIGLNYSRKEALIGYLSGTVSGALVLLATASVFPIVGIAFVLVRVLQLFVLIYLKDKKGILASSLLAAIIGSFMATLLGLAYYGEGALSTALSFYDVIYLLPAYLAARFLKSRAILMAVCVILFTFILFLSVSTFLILYSFSLSVIFLISSFFYLRIKESNISAKRITMGIAVIVLIFSYIFFLTSPSSQYVLRSTFYALYPDSLNKAQWYQKNSSSECVQGNLAGDWTEEGGVYDPQRLRVIDTCVTVIGTIVGIFPSSGPASDNDFTLDLKLDPEYQYLLSLGSYWFKSGYLHIEVVPKDQSSVLGHLVLKPGMKIKVTGVWVLDTDHGWWSEIHPAWSIEILS